MTNQWRSSTRDILNSQSADGSTPDDKILNESATTYLDGQMINKCQLCVSIKTTG